jgi:threonine aldolase
MEGRGGCAELWLRQDGGLSTEALVLFDESLADSIRRRRKRSGHLLSKGRYLAAQLLAMVEDGVWLENGQQANEAARRLAEAAGERLVYPVEANEVFLKVTPEEAAALRAQGFDFYDWGVGEARLVTSWDQDMGAVDRLAEAIRGL